MAGNLNGNTTSQNFGQGYGTNKNKSNQQQLDIQLDFNTNGGTSTDSLQQIQTTTAFDGWKLQVEEHLQRQIYIWNFKWNINSTIYRK